MIDLYFWKTDNGYKARQAAEESGLPYRIVPVNIGLKEQFATEFMAISPGHKIPAIVDHDGPGGAPISLCESGAILKYLAEKAGREKGGNGLYPTDARARVVVDQWLFYGSATFTTLAQQFGHWVVRSPESVPPAKANYTAVLRDMLGTLDRRLAEHEFVAGDYSIADISMYPDTHIHGVNDVGLTDFPNVQRWHDTIAARPAVVRAWGPY